MFYLFWNCADWSIIQNTALIDQLVEHYADWSPDSEHFLDWLAYSEHYGDWFTHSAAWSAHLEQCVAIDWSAYFKALS